MDSDAEPTALSADDFEDLPQEADDDDAGDGIEKAVTVIVAKWKAKAVQQ